MMIERKTEMNVIIEHAFETKDKVWLSEESVRTVLENNLRKAKRFGINPSEAKMRLKDVMQELDIKKLECDE